MMKVERVMQDFLDPLDSFSCTTPYFLQTSFSVSASSRIETPCWSRKSAWQRQSSGLTPSTTQSWRENTSSWAEKTVAPRVQVGVASLGEKKRTTGFFPRDWPLTPRCLFAAGDGHK